MKARHLPEIDARYWGLLVLASIFGANTGDVVADVAGFGHVAGLPILFACFLLVALAERLDPAPRNGWFWLAIIVTRTAATNVGDVGHDLHWPAGAAVAGLAALLVATLAAWRLAPSAMLGMHPLFWWTMLVAGALGTAIGDWWSYGLGFGNLGAAAALGVAAAGTLLFVRGRRPVPLAGYWLAVVAIRAAATAGGDFLAHAFGLELSTFVTGVAFGLALTAARVLGSGKLPPDSRPA